MEIVVDSSVVLAIVLNEPERSALITATRGASLIAPGSIHWEIGNALSAMLKRTRISVDQAVQTISAYRAIPIRFVPVDIELALRIAGSLRIYAYDAYILQCAKQYRTQLLTLDRQLLEAARGLNARVIEVCK